MVRSRIEAATDDLGHRHIQMIGDCVSWMRAIPDDTADIVFADPPYVLNNASTRLHSGKLVVDDQMSWDVIDHLPWLSEVARILRPGGTVFVCCTYHSLFEIGAICTDGLGLKVLNHFTLEKDPAPPCVTARMARQDTENLLWFSKGPGWTFNKTVLRDEGLKSVWPYPVREVRGLPHPTPKPISIVRRALLMASNPGDLVVDPFSGINTVGVVGWQLKRNVVSIERDASYARIGSLRLRDHGVPVGSRIVRRTRTERQCRRISRHEGRRQLARLTTQDS